MDKKFLIIICGPTASGKTPMALYIARHFHTVIINADSRQIYTEMSIGTAKPNREQLAAIKHYLIGNKSIHDYYNASMYEVEVLDLLKKLFLQHDVVVMVGGSGMYINAVCRGIDEFPSTDPPVREKMKRIYEEEGISGIRELLKTKDAEYYQKVDINNPQRILKALEIIEMTGKPYSSFLTGRYKKRDFSTVKIGLNLPRPVLHQRISQRVDHMLENGLLGEIKELHPFRHMNALNTVGYKEFFDYAEQKTTFEEAVEKVKAHTRQYARRQLTWFNKDKDISWFHPEDTKKIIKHIYSKTGNHGIRRNKIL